MEVQVYPEYFNGEVAKEGVSIFAKITPEKYSRMYISNEGVVESYYDKIGSDGKNVRSTKEFSPVVYVYGSVAIGIVCCMDIDDPAVISAVKEELYKTGCMHKVIAVSAYMTHNGWFSGDLLQPNLHGMHVVLSNGCSYGVTSFIADPKGLKTNKITLSLGDVTIKNCGII